MKVSKIGKVLIILLAFGILLGPMGYSQVFATHTSAGDITTTISAGSATETYTFDVTCTSGANITQVNITVPDGVVARFTVDSGTISNPSGWNHVLYPSPGNIIKIIWNATAPQYRIQSGSTKYFTFEAQAPSPSSDTAYNWTVDTRDIADDSHSYDVTTWVDVTPPTIVFVSPEEGADILGVITVQFDVIDLTSGVSSVQWQWVRGIGYDVPTDPSDIGPWRNAAYISGDRWQFEFNGTDFATGFYTFRVRAYDAMGGLSIETITYRNIIELPVWVFPVAIMVSLMLVVVGVMSYYRMKKRGREKRIRELNEILKEE